MPKVFVEVNVRCDLQGNMISISFLWNDGRLFEIDKVLDKRRSASLKAGGQGIRYICRIKGKDVNLFYDEPIWFVEGK